MHPTRRPGPIVSCRRRDLSPQFGERFLSKTVRLLRYSPKIERRPRRTVLDMLESKAMLGRVALSLTLVAAMVVAETSVSSTCTLPNAPNQKTCASPCCATKPCCATSGKRNGESVPPFTALTSPQQSFVAFTPAASGVQVAPPSATGRPHFSVADVQSHSPETLAFLCIRLI
jgi:hypothetical protein